MHHLMARWLLVGNDGIGSNHSRNMVFVSSEYGDKFNVRLLLLNSPSKHVDSSWFWELRVKSKCQVKDYLIIGLKNTAAMNDLFSW